MNLFCCLLVLALPPDSSVLTVDEVVVTAERVRHPIRDVAASVSVLTASDLDRSLASTATAALGSLAGVFVQKTGQFGRTDIDIRGVGDRGCRVQVLVDGRPEKMPIYGCVVTHTLPLNNVERIEVVRGPLSVLYGSDAMAGVVNIVTRRAQEPLELRAQLDFGSFNTRHAVVSTGLKQGAFDVLVSGDKATSDGHLPNSHYNGNDLSVRAGYGFSPALRLDFTGKYFTGVKHEPKRSTDPETLVASGWNQYDRGGLDLTATVGTEALGGFAKLYRTFGEHQFSDGWHSTDFTNGAILHTHCRSANGNLIQAGVEANQLSGTQILTETNEATWTRLQAAFFVQDEQTLGPVTANAGLRLSADELSGAALGPKAGLVFRPLAATTLRGSVNRGFRYPSLYQTSVSAVPLKNESLRPEVSWNFETGIRQEFGRGLALDVVGFTFQGHDLIEAAPNQNPPPGKLFLNTGRFSFKGIETALELKSGPWRGSVTYALTDFGANTRARAGSKLNVSAGITVSELDLDLSAQHVGSYYAADSSESPIPSYLTLDLSAGYRLLQWFEFLGSVENLLDSRYDAFADLPGAQAGLYRMPGRSFRAGVSVTKP